MFTSYGKINLVRPEWASLCRLAPSPTIAGTPPQAGLTYLQRALLAHDLRALAAVEWEACFRQVIFPLLARLLEPVTADASALEETRMRAATLLCKAFLQHLSPLLALPGFTDLWLDILDFMDRYIHSGNSGRSLLYHGYRIDRVYRQFWVGRL